MARIVVSGYMIRHPFAGNVLAFFHYVLGLCRLGHDVVYLEESGWPNSCYDPQAGDYSDDPRAGLQFVRALFATHGARAPVYYVNRDNSRVYGTDWHELKRVLGAADLLLNIGGVCWLPEFRSCRHRALIDMDPLFTQVGRFGAEGIHEYHTYFSYGVNIGRSGCTVPTGGIEWRPTVPPVVPEIWRDTDSRRTEREKGDAPESRALTTIANWSAYGAVTYRGEHYGQKDEEFLRLVDLPSRTSQTLELALSGASEEVMQKMRTAGWSIRDAGELSRDMDTYRAYITSSRGEFSAAKHAYVKTRSGWFSDRSVCYLAAGLPTILQDTGFSDWLPTGRGVLTFSSTDEAADCIETLNAEYAAHCCAASEVAARTFSYKVVLPQILDILL